MIKKVRDLKFSKKSSVCFFMAPFLFWGQGAFCFDTSDDFDTNTNTNINIKSFYDCDELFCVDKNDGSYKKNPNDIDDFVPQIGFKRVEERVKFDIGQNSQRSEGKNGEGITTVGVPDESPTSDTVENPETAGEDPQDPAKAQASGWGSGSGGGSQAQGARGSRFSAMGAAGGQVRGSKVGGTSLGGVNEAKKIRIEGGGAYSSNLASLNRSNRGEPGGTPGNGGNQRGGGPPSVAPSGSGGLGGSASGAHSSNTGKKKEKGFLSKLASKVGLGRYFGGGSGGGSSGNFYRGKSSGQGKLKTASKASKGRLKSPEDILRENFNRNMRRRNLANSPEFGSSRTSLFQNICEHYDNYARSHSIPDNRKHCPRD